MDKEKLQKARKYWNDGAKRALHFPLSSGFGGVPEYWDYEDRLQKKALTEALDSLKLNMEKATILDVGCGSGRLSFWFAERCAGVYGIDISSQAIRNATLISHQISASRVYFLVFNGFTFPFEDNIYDIVNMSSVLLAIEKVGLTERIVSEMIRVCKAGGIILLLELVRSYEDEYRKAVPENRIISLFNNNGANLVLCRGIYVDRIRFYFHYLSRFRRAWTILRLLTPAILRWSWAIDKNLTPFFSKYAEKKLFVFRKETNDACA